MNNRSNYMMSDEDFETLKFKIKFYLVGQYLSKEQAEDLHNWISAGTHIEK